MKTPESLKPKVFKAKDGRFLIIVYNDREETYDHARTSTFKQLTEDRKTETDPNPEPYTRHDSIELCQDMREVHYSDKMKVHGLICTCKEYEQYPGDKNPIGQKGCTCRLINDDDREIQKLETDYIELK